MGLKRRTFTGTLQTAIMRALPRGTSLTRKQLMQRLRAMPKVAVSNRRLAAATKRLLDDGKLRAIGKRARLRFKRA